MAFWFLFLDPLLGQVLTRGSPGHASLTRTLLSQSTHIRYIWAQAPLLPETNRKGAAIATCIYIYICIYIYTCLYVLCMYVCMYVCIMYVLCMYVCMYVCR